jgi:hypothetical protein
MGHRPSTTSTKGSSVADEVTNKQKAGTQAKSTTTTKPKKPRQTAEQKAAADDKKAADAQAKSDAQRVKDDEASAADAQRAATEADAAVRNAEQQAVDRRDELEEKAKDKNAVLSKDEEKAIAQLKQEGEL